MNVAYGSLRLGAATLYRRMLSRPHVARWSELDSFEAEWDSRSALIADLVAPGAHVLEFGAGRRRLEALLPTGCTYVPSDIVSRGPGTLVVDLDARPLPSLSAIEPDVVVFAGVFEYLGGLADVPAWLAGEVSTCIASYECAASPARSVARLRETARRYRNGWVSTYTEDELVDLFAQVDFTCTSRRTWTTPDGAERVFVFERR